MQYSYFDFASDIWHYIKPYRLRFFVAFFCRLTSDLSQLYPAYALSRTIYLLTLNHSDAVANEIIQLLGIWIVLALYRSITKETAKYLGFTLAEQAALDLYKDCVTHMFSLDLSWHEIENSGNKFKRISSGREGMDQIIRRFFSVFIEVGVNTIGIFLIFLQQQVTIAFALVFFVFTFYPLGLYLLKKPTYYQKKTSKQDEDLGGVTFEAFNNVRTVKSLAIDVNILSLIYESIGVLVKNIKRRIFWFRFQTSVLVLYFYTFEIAVIIFIVYGIWQGNYPISLLILFVGLYHQVGESIWEMMDVTQEVVVSKIWVGRAKSILKTQPEIEHPEKLLTQLDFPKEWKRIDVKNVKFTYTTTDVLKDISFTIKRGEKIGIVGVSGSGKSTLFKLLMDLYEDYTGEILIDNTSLADIKRQSYVDHLSVVLQDTELFNMSLKDNIIVTGVPGQKEDSQILDSVIATAHLEDVIADLPQGINTLVGEKGIKLSGGQRQRVGIARALYRQPEILLLDEATSHLDVHSEKQIQKALHEAFGKCTAVVIAHRLSTIKEMDRILVMENGIIKESGKFDELLKNKGTFAKMWEEQTL